jgi:hypothetical protein
MDQPMAAQSLALLEPLVGEWTLEATGPDGVAWPGEGRAVFEWHSSGAHLIQRASIDVPGAPASVSIIGCDAANGMFVQLYSDERGVCRIFSMRLDGAEWTLERAGEPFPQRFVGTISEGARTISGCWEKAEDGEDFVVDFYLSYRKVTPPER